jgi:YesN/AraC family two-component response regulator
MPEMNGRELSDKIKALRPEIKVIYTSGYTADIIAKQGLIQDGVHFLQKPVTFDMLTTKVREVLDAAL